MNPAERKAEGAAPAAVAESAEPVHYGYWVFRDGEYVRYRDVSLRLMTHENLFIFRDGVAYTPPVTDDILEGITRGCVIELLRKELGIQVVERSIDRTELYVCDEILLCGTAAQVTPVVEIDRRQVGSGEIGEVARTLQASYFAAVKGDKPKYTNWLTPVY